MAAYVTLLQLGSSSEFVLQVLGALRLTRAISLPVLLTARLPRVPGLPRLPLAGCLPVARLVRAS